MNEKREPVFLISGGREFQCRGAERLEGRNIQLSVISMTVKLNIKFLSM